MFECFQYRACVVNSSSDSEEDSKPTKKTATKLLLKKINLKEVSAKKEKVDDSLIPLNKAKEYTLVLIEDVSILICDYYFDS